MDLFEQGRQAFNEGRYFEAHELWEELWTPMSGVERRRLQGLIHFAVGLYHYHSGNSIGAKRQFRKALDKTADCPASWRAVRIEATRGAIAQLLEALEAGKPLETVAFRL